MAYGRFAQNQCAEAADWRRAWHIRVGSFLDCVPEIRAAAE